MAMIWIAALATAKTTTCGNGDEGTARLMPSTTTYKYNESGSWQPEGDQGAAIEKAIGVAVVAYEVTSVLTAAAETTVTSMASTKPGSAHSPPVPPPATAVLTTQVSSWKRA